MQNTTGSLEALYLKWVNKKASPQEEQALFELLSRIDIDNRLAPLMKARWEEQETLQLTGEKVRHQGDSSAVQPSPADSAEHEKDQHSSVLNRGGVCENPQHEKDQHQRPSALSRYSEEHQLKMVREILEKYPSAEGNDTRDENDARDDNEMNMPASAHRVHFLKTAWFRYAAAILLMLSLAFYLWPRPGQEKELAVSGTEPTTPGNNTVVVPGGDKAVLTLADGSTIILDNAIDGQLAQQAGATITKSATGEIVYSADPSALSLTPTYNTMATPRGGNYRLSLPDGSLVWLNAASAITFPTVFSGAERSVSISGEVYFEVAKDEQRPFRVMMDNHTQIEVLGTHFNVNAYQEESSANTTLLEGSVRIKNDQAERVLHPGQQAQVDAAGKMILKKNVDIQSVIAWKQDEFHFGEKADFKAAMRQIARWYDVEVEYQGTISGHLGGSISRKADISLVLKMLEKAGGVKFILDGKKLTVMPST